MSINLTTKRLKDNLWVVNNNKISIGYAFKMGDQYCYECEEPMFFTMDKLVAIQKLLKTLP